MVAAFQYCENPKITDYKPKGSFVWWVSFTWFSMMAKRMKTLLKVGLIWEVITRRSHRLGPGINLILIADTHVYHGCLAYPAFVWTIVRSHPQKLTTCLQTAIYRWQVEAVLGWILTSCRVIELAAMKRAGSFEKTSPQLPLYLWSILVKTAVLVPISKMVPKQCWRPESSGGIPWWNPQETGVVHKQVCEQLRPRWTKLLTWDWITTMFLG